MPSSDNSSFPVPPADGLSMAVRQPTVLEQHDGRWTAPAGPVPAAAPGPDLVTVLHALRRHWLLATALGVVLAATAATIVFLWLPGPKYEAAAYLRVSTFDRPLVFRTAENEVEHDVQAAYEIYKNTQKELLKNRFVLQAALRKPDLRSLPMLPESDPVVWLQRKLNVDFPGHGEIMEVAMQGRNPDEITKLVNGVVNSFLSDVVDKERTKRRARLDDLEKLYPTQEDKVRDKRTQLKELADQLGVDTTRTVSLKQEIAMRAFAEYQGQYMRTLFELRRVEAERKALEALRSFVDKEQTVTQLDIEDAAKANRVLGQLAEELGMLKMSAGYTKISVAAKSRSPYVERNKFQTDALEAQYNEVLKQLEDQVRAQRLATVDKDLVKKQEEFLALRDQADLFVKELKQKQDEAEKLSGGSVRLEMLRSDIEQLDKSLGTIAKEREALEVELKAAPRVTLFTLAETPQSYCNSLVRYVLTVLAVIVGLCLPAFCLVLWDMRTRRINTSADVSRGLGVPVIGSIPVIPTRVIRRLGDATKRSQSWHIRLTESVDSVAARLLRYAELKQTRVVLVSSAVGGEGKTTLTTQLAMSLARSGRRTLLVDFDLRRPALAAVFGVPLEPGVSDALRGQSDLSAIVHPTATENLSLAPAGRWDREAMAALGNGKAAAIFEALRKDYDFVIVDAAPILPVADTRFISQHVDAVLLSVFRDVSQAAQVQEAAEILEAFGVHRVEAVVTGPCDNLRDKDLGYEARLPG